MCLIIIYIYIIIILTDVDYFNLKKKWHLINFNTNDKVIKVSVI